jgi:hypothetical protein
VEAWLQQIARDGSAGQNIAEVDYDVYAAGEAALGWLNAAVHLRAEQAVDWRKFCQDLMAAIQRQLDAVGAEVAHLKLRLTAGQGSVVASLTSTEGMPSLRGAIPGEPPEALLLLNARAHAQPEQLQSIIRQCLTAAGGPAIHTAIDDIRCFAPGRPQPTHRFAR